VSFDNLKDLDNKLDAKMNLGRYLESKGIKDYVTRPIFVIALLAIILCGVFEAVRMNELGVLDTNKHIYLECKDSKPCVNQWAACNNGDVFVSDCDSLRGMKCDTANCHNEMLMPGEVAGVKTDSHILRDAIIILLGAFLVNNLFYMWRNR
jgi:hypothetical protein